MRKCFNCATELPPETEHFVYENETYCTDCLEAKPYTAYVYELNGEFIGLSENDDVEHVDDYEDEYERTSKSIWCNDCNTVELVPVNKSDKCPFCESDNTSINNW